jgi:3-oxoadipate enol-lactonase
MPRIKAGSLNINYETFGEGEPLLLIMGFGMPGRAWLPRIPRFAGFKVVTYDNRGTGESDRPDIPVYSIADMADDASALLRALEIPRTKICGFSMGGMIAQELTLRHPDQVIKAVFGCTTAGGSSAKMENPGGGEPLRMASFQLLASDPDKAYEELLPMLHPAELLATRPELRHDMLDAIKTAPPTPVETYARHWAGIMGFNAYDRLGQLRCPVLIVHGDQDIGTPIENAHILKSRIPHAQLLIVPGAGHGLETAQRNWVTDRIAAWLRE